MFVLGCPTLIVTVDHEPLVRLFGNRDLHEIANPRLLRLKEKTLQYSYSIKYLPGKNNVAADALSRHPQSKPDTPGSLIDAITEASVTGILASVDTLHEYQSVTWDWDQTESHKDPVLSDLAELVTTGFPEHKQSLPPKLQPYWDVRHELSRVGDSIVLGSRAVIPASLRTEVLQGLHAAHQGVAGMKARARYSVYWPGISAAIVNHRNTCRRCDIIAPSKSSESLCPPPKPEYPFQLVVSDFCEVAGQKFLIYRDRYSAWVSISMSRTEGSGSKFVISELRKWFAIYGVPEEISSDGGPPYTSHEVGAFLSAWGVRHRVCSARYPQSNGRAELSVKTAKRLIYDNTKHGSLDTDSFVRALLQHRNTPLEENGHSPAELLYGRPLRDHLPHPVDMANIRPEWLAVASDRELALAKRNIRNVTAFNERNWTKDLPSLCSGDIVAVQNQSGPSPGRWDRTGIVREVRPNRQYVIQMHGSQRLVLHNRVHLRKVTPLLSPNRALATPYAGSTAVAAPSPPRRSSSPTALDRVPIPRSNISRPINTAPPRTGDVSQNGADCPTEPLPDHAPINPEAMERQPEGDGKLPNDSSGRPTRAHRPPKWHKDYVMWLYLFKCSGLNCSISLWETTFHNTLLILYGSYF